MRWKLVPCGPRDEAFRKFRRAAQNTDGAVVLLLLDAEGPVAMEPGAHLKARDGWDMADVGAGSVYLMVQTMEAWIVADADALDRYYGRGFRAELLPKAADLESVAKSEIEGSLRRATQRTRKGRYHKIRHASDLLQRVDAEKVKARCGHCRRLFDELGRMIDQSQGNGGSAMTPRLCGAEYLGEYRIFLTFDDGKRGVIDLKHELWGEVFEPLRDVELFRRFRFDAELDTIVWPTGAGLAPEYMYESAVASEREPAAEVEVTRARPKAADRLAATERAAKMIHATDVEPRDGYRIWLRYSDGAAGEVDLSDMAGRGVFKVWLDRAFFEGVHVSRARVDSLERRHRAVRGRALHDADRQVGGRAVSGAEEAGRRCLSSARAKVIAPLE